MTTTSTICLLPLLLLLSLSLGPIPSFSKSPHVIKFRYLNLYPEGLAYDPTAQHFIVGSLHDRTIHSVSDAGVLHTLISDPSLPENSTFLGLAVDSLNNRLLAAVHSSPPLPSFNALACYDLSSGRRIFLSELPDDGDSSPVANGVAVDFKGNAYVTNSNGNFIWKVNDKGEPSVFSRSPAFTRYPVDRDKPYSYSGINGIAYLSKGYLLAVQSNTGKMFKVDEEDGSARAVLLNRDLEFADGIAVRSDGVVLVVSHKKLVFLKSQDSWGEGVFYDEIALDEDGFATSVVAGMDDRAYVLYGSVIEGIVGNGGREWFAIEEVRSKKESEQENIWIFVLIGFGLAYFLFWRFQMKQLVTNMDKKTH